LLAYLVRRLLVMIPMMLIASFLMFVVISFSGDPLAGLKTMQPPPPPEVLHAMAVKLRLDQPLLAISHFSTDTGCGSPACSSGISGRAFTISISVRSS